jgi:hypothetical protein
LEASTTAPQQETLTRANARLYQLLVDLDDRADRFRQVLTRGLITGAPSPPLASGFFLAATGEVKAFMADVFELVVDCQNEVSWTAETLRVDASYRRKARLGYVGLAIAAAIVIALAIGARVG